MGSYRLECQYPKCDKVYEAHNEYRLCCDHELSGHHWTIQQSASNATTSGKGALLSQMLSRTRVPPSSPTSMCTLPP